MGLQNNINLKQLYQDLPEGIVVPSSWFTSQGYSPQLLKKYVDGSWIIKVGRGAYTRREMNIKWEGAVLGLQRFAKKPFHIGGITALYMQGHVHYLPLGGEKKIYLYGRSKAPAWFTNMNLPYKFVFHVTPFPNATLGIKQQKTHIEELTIDVSTPERAIMELLNEVKKDSITFQFVAEIFENLTSLRPSLVNQLLMSNLTNKIKRMFLFLADYYNHPWFKYIETNNINIGSGNLQIVKGGVLDHKYLITVPKEYYAG